MKAGLVLNGRDLHGEGIFWSSAHQLLYWTDIFGERVWTYDPVTGDARNHPTPGKVCCFATRAGRPWNEVVAAFSDGFAFLDLATGQRDDIAPLNAETPSIRMNDGRTDRQGRLIAGAMEEDGLKPNAFVYRLDPDGSVTKLFGGVGCSNGTCFSADGRTMFFADSPTGRLEAFDYDGVTGTPSNRRVIALSSGIPDGSCVDAEGYIWNAVWEGYRIERYAPNGRLDRIIEVPVHKPTCLAFGGADLSTLYITSSRLGESKADLVREPMAGGVFAVIPGVRGLEDKDFAG